MKFSEINREQWAELEPYLDTCLLPVTGLSGKENPVEAADLLEKLRDVMDHIEIPFRGRVVTVPAIQYQLGSSEQFFEEIDALCRNLKTVYQYVIVASLLQRPERCESGGADLWISPLEGDKEIGAHEISRMIQRLWTNNT